MMSVLGWERYEGSVNHRLPSYGAVKHAIIADSRNDLVRQFLAAEPHDPPEWLWVLDPDVVFEPDTCARLMQLADPDRAPIVAAAYWNEIDDQLALTWHAHTKDGLRLFKCLPDLDGGIELASCGMGCTLIHRTVLEKLQEILPDDPWPWFGHDIVPTAKGLERAGEDVTFCLRARQAGFKVIGHCGVTVEHYKPHYMAHGEVVSNGG